MRVAIVGGGISGLAFANVFERFGHACTVFEKADRIGGIWATSYPDVRLQNSRERYHFIDLPWPTPPEQHPTARQILAYLDHAVEHFRIDVRLLHEVTAVAPRDGGWTVTTRTPGGETRAEFDYVVVGIGQYSEGKRRPQFDGEDVFSGTVVTERDIDALDLFDGRRVVVVGFGKSAVDIASFAAPRAARVDHVFRTPRWLIPFRILGVHFTYPFFARMSTFFMPSWTHGIGAERILHRRLPAVVQGFWRLIGWIVKRHMRAHGRNLGSPALQRLDAVTPAHGYAADLRSATAMAPLRYFELIARGTIEPHHAGLSRFTPDGVVLADGTTLAAEIVVLAVGSDTPIFPFFPQELRNMLEANDDGVQLFRHLLHPAIPNLAFAGYNHGFMHIPAAEIGALWLCAHLDGDIELPSSAEMERCIRYVTDWKRRNVHYEPSRSCAVSTRFQQYIDVMLTELGLSPYRKFPNVAAEVFGRYGAADYADLINEYRRRRAGRKVPLSILDLHT